MIQCYMLSGTSCQVETTGKEVERKRKSSHPFSRIHVCSRTVRGEDGLRCQDTEQGCSQYCAPFKHAIVSDRPGVS